MESPTNGEASSGLEDTPNEPEVQHLDFFDDIHQTSTLKSLNMMRKNRHFCDVILHVCAWLYKRHVLHVTKSHAKTLPS